MIAPLFRQEWSRIGRDTRQHRARDAAITPPSFSRIQHISTIGEARRKFAVASSSSQVRRGIKVSVAARAQGVRRVSRD
jgi:hypothetical protein